MVTFGKKASETFPPGNLSLEVMMSRYLRQENRILLKHIKRIQQEALPQVRAEHRTDTTVTLAICLKSDCLHLSPTFKIAHSFM